MLLKIEYLLFLYIMNITLNSGSIEDREEAIMQLIGEFKEKIFEKSIDYAPPLHAAVMMGSVRAVKALIDLHADPNVANRKGNTALHFAVGHRMVGLDKTIEIVKMLLKAGANPNLKNSKGEGYNWIKLGESEHQDTPLHLLAHRLKQASGSLFVDLLNTMLEGGGDLTLLNFQWETPAAGIFQFLHRHPDFWKKIPQTFILKMKNDAPIPDQANEQIAQTVENINAAITTYRSNKPTHFSSYDDDNNSRAYAQMEKCVEIVKSEIEKLAVEAKLFPHKPIYYFKDQKRVISFVKNALSNSRHYLQALGVI